MYYCDSTRCSSGEASWDLDSQVEGRRYRALFGNSNDSFSSLVTYIYILYYLSFMTGMDDSIFLTIVTRTALGVHVTSLRGVPAQRPLYGRCEEEGHTPCTKPQRRPLSRASLATGTHPSFALSSSTSAPSASGTASGNSTGSTDTGGDQPTTSSATLYRTSPFSPPRPSPVSRAVLTGPLPARSIYLPR